MTKPKGPLSGIRVLDASMGAVGPWAGVLLGQLGADVVKLESPQGDFIRQITPRKKGLSTTYISMNFNKRPVVFDLKLTEERATVHKLAAQADIFIENFRPGVADRIGVGYPELSALNPKLIYASASGFGRSGPMVGVGATDPHLQPFTGSCSVNGKPGGKLQRWRWYGHFDCTTAMCIVEGVVAALLERDRTGKGKLLELTMVEAALTLQRVRVSEHLSGQTPGPMGSATTYIVPDQAFGTQDNPIAITASSRREWRDFCTAIGRPGLADDARFARNPDRIRNRAALIAILDEIFAKRPAQYWLDVMRRAKVPAALFTSYDEFRHNVHYLESKMLTSFQTKDWGTIDMAGVPWRFSETPGSLFPGDQPGAYTAQFADGNWPAPADA
jgi:crotonobetainyl-CoA:carnitine CoA-transferase CaiB-like acyl-CoA transferase